MEEQGGEEVADVDAGQADEEPADRGVVSAELAMYLPVALFTLAGLLAVASANREMGTARTAGLGEWLRDLFRRRRSVQP